MSHFTIRHKQQDAPCNWRGIHVDFITNKQLVFRCKVIFLLNFFKKKVHFMGW